MGAHRRLTGYVIVDGTPFGPDDHLPERIAVRITNPAAWEPDPHPATVASAPPAPVMPAADVPDPPPAGRGDTAVPDTAVPDVATAERGAAPVTPDPVVPDEPTVTPDDTPSPDSTAPGPGVDEVEVPEPVSPPPRSGKGSGIDAWRAYARAVHVAVPEGAERADIITACEKAGHLPPP